jgi:hypothetical protein
MVATHRRSRLILDGHEIGVSRDAPMTVAFFPHDSERITRAPNGRPVRRRDSYAKPIAKVGPIANDLKLFDIACPLEPNVLHPLMRRGEGGLAERLLTGREENDVVGHQAEHGRDVVPLAGFHPTIDDVADRSLVWGHPVARRADLAANRD